MIDRIEDLCSRLSPQTVWVLQGAGIGALVLSAILLFLSIVGAPESVVTITDTRWVCTKTQPDGIRAACTEYQRLNHSKE